jgi:hypothetical protein
VLRVGQLLLIRGTYTVADPDYSPDKIDVKIIGHEEGSDEAAYFGSGTCKPMRRPGTKDGFDFQIELPAPKYPGKFKVDAMTSAKLHGFNGFYTTGVAKIRVLPALADMDQPGPEGMSSGGTAHTLPATLQPL